MARGNGSSGLLQIGRGPKPPEKERFDALKIVSGAGDGDRTRDPLLGKHLIELIRQAFPAARKSIQFFRVGEVQARSAIHYHLALRGLQWLPKGLLQKLAVQAGFGYIVDVRLLRNIGGGVNYFATNIYSRT